MTTESHPAGTDWREVYLGGSESAEDLMIESWALEMQRFQRSIAQSHSDTIVRRGFQAKTHLGVDNAEFVVSDDLPTDLQIGPFIPAARYRATVRLSNGSGDVSPDSKRDLRGLGIRLQVTPDTTIDLLGTSGPASFARDPKQFMDFARASMGPRLLLIPTLIRAVGPREAIRMVRTALADTGETVASLATTQFWSRGAFRYGDFAMRFTFAPVLASAPEPDSDDPDYLRHEIAERLRTESASWDFRIQLFADEAATPIEDASEGWDSAYVTLARLTIPSQDVTVSAHQSVEEAVDALETNPWNTVDELRPIGSINRARRRIYEASAAARKGR